MKNFIIYIIITLSLIAGVSYAAETIIDISSQTNLTAGDHITLNDDELDVADDWWDALTDMVLTDTYIYVGNASNDPVGVTMSNDCTISNTGAITCDHDALDNYLAAEHIDWTATTSVFEGWGDHSTFDYATTGHDGDYITDLDLDAEIYTHRRNIAFTDATTSSNRVDHYVSFGVDVTITEFGGISDGEMVVECGECLETSLSTSSQLASLTMDTDSASTTSFTDAAIGARSRLKCQVASIESGTSTWIYLQYEIVD